MLTRSSKTASERTLMLAASIAALTFLTGCSTRGFREASRAIPNLAKVKAVTEQKVAYVRERADLPNEKVQAMFLAYVNLSSAGNTWIEQLKQGLEESNTYWIRAVLETITGQGGKESGDDGKEGGNGNSDAAKLTRARNAVKVAVSTEDDASARNLEELLKEFDEKFSAVVGIETNYKTTFKAQLSLPGLGDLLKVFQAVLKLDDERREAVKKRLDEFKFKGWHEIGQPNSKK